MARNGLVTLPDVRARISFPSNSKRPSGKQKYVEITIRDEASNLVIIEVEIEPEDLINLLSGGEAPGIARMLAPEYVDRLGKEMIHSTISLSDEDLNRGYASKPDHPTVTAARERAFTSGWQTAEYRFSHGSHTLVLRRWE